MRHASIQQTIVSPFSVKRRFFEEQYLYSGLKNLYMYKLPLTAPCVIFPRQTKDKHTLLCLSAQHAHVTPSRPRYIYVCVCKCRVPLRAPPRGKICRYGVLSLFSALQSLGGNHSFPPTPTIYHHFFPRREEKKHRCSSFSPPSFRRP